MALATEQGVAPGVKKTECPDANSESTVERIEGRTEQLPGTGIMSPDQSEESVKNRQQKYPEEHVFSPALALESKPSKIAKKHDQQEYQGWNDEMLTENKRMQHTGACNDRYQGGKTFEAVSQGKQLLHDSEVRS